MKTNLIVPALCFVSFPAFVSLPANGALPPLVEELRPMNEKIDPGFADVGLAVQAMGRIAPKLSAEDRAALGTFAIQLKLPFTAESAYQHYAKQADKCLADIRTGKADLERLKKNPPISPLSGTVNRELLGLYQDNANSMIERGKYDFAYQEKYGTNILGSIGGERGLAFIEFMKGKTVRELEATNSAAAAYLREGRSDLALALAAAIFGVADRQKLELNFEPAMSYIWVRMKKMTPAQRQELQTRARGMLIGHVAIHEGAKVVNEMSVDEFYDSLKEGDALGAGLSLFVLNAGMEEQARRDRRINECLEVLFFQEEPGDYAIKMRLALDRLLEPVPSKTVEERLAANVVKDVLRTISPKLATQEVADVLVGVLKAGFEASKK